MTATSVDVPNKLRSVAHMIRIEHGPSCPYVVAWRHAAALLERVADAEESGAVLRVGERDRALAVADGYLHRQPLPDQTTQPRGVPRS